MSDDRTTRDEALAILEEGQSRLDALTAGLSDEELEAPATMGGGDWSARDLLGHVASWEEYALEAITARDAGEQPWIDATSLDVDGVNARDVPRKRQMPLADLRQAVADTHALLVAAITSMTDEQWSAAPSYRTDRPKTVGNEVGDITASGEGPFRHAFAHLPDLEGYVTTLRGEGELPG